MSCSTKLEFSTAVIWSRRNGWSPGLILLGLTLVMSFVPSTLFGQSTSSSIVGTVTDESGAAIPGATVTVTNVGTQRERTVQTNERGDYSVTALDIGQYEVSATMDGFSRAVATNVRLEVDAVRRQNLTLQIGAVTEQITVQADALTIQTDDTTISTVIDEDKIRELPIPGDRNLFRLALLAPGMSRGPKTSVTTSGFGPGYGIAAQGQKVHNNNIILDGAPLRTGIHGMVRMRPSVEAIQEFRIESGWYNAEFGSQSGAQIITSIRPGTNDFHGTLFHFFRAEELDARNYFEDDHSIPKRPLTRNTFGGVLSGPIVSNKLFFTTNIEIFRERRSGQSFGTFPSQLMRQGNLTESFFAGSPILDISTCLDPADASTCGTFANNIIPQNRISPIATRVMSFWPNPNFGSSEFDGQQNYSTTTKNDLDDDQFYLRNDWNVNDKNKIFGRYGFQDVLPASVNVLASTDPRFIGFNPKRQQNATVNWTRFITNTMLNELRVSYNRDIFNRTSGFTDTGWNNLTELGIPGQTTNSFDARPTSIAVTGCCSLGTSDVNQIWDESRSVGNALSFISGNHNVKMGAEYFLVRTARRTISFANGDFNFTGVHSGAGFADFLLDQPQRVRLGNIPGEAEAGTFPDFRYWRLHPYIQDEWKMTPNLTLNMGLRWEYNSPFEDARGESRNFDKATGELFPAPGMARVALNDVSKNNWAPRFGVAWRPLGGTDFVIRTGYGIFYNVNMINNFVPILAANPPQTLRIEETALARRPIITMATADQAQNRLLQSSVSGAATDHTVGMVQQWNINVQKTLPWSFVAEVGYSGSKSDHFDMPAEYNAFLPNTIGTANPIRPYSGFSSIEIHDNSASGNYHGLLTKLERRFSQGFTVLQTYTWSKAMFDSRACCGADRPANPWDRRTAERGRGDFDITHRTTTAFLWDLPFGNNFSGAAKHILGGWQVNGVLVLQTGLPIHPNQGTVDPTPGDGCPRCTRRPNRIADGNLSGSQRSLDRWFNTDAFVLASPANQALYGLGLYGNSGRAILEEPGRNSLDFSIFKNFAIKEGHRFQIRWEMYNATNTPPFNTPQLNILNGNFGRITSADESREMQLGLRYQF
ncbi:MAG TPA: carboxypeptidase regulatory-like domain-containing protein [Bryobacterales bacterium]|nr:carboxypeptidase regulatory-like domain-containing protein [Bryobacterales bacterium]